ncbi:GNAT family N-acetyltransferase [Oceanobacillus arenosus]|uniref:GNAT family N-acetyltransferase n=1 Tax=Oceanobacillus arenosus TaxID=1229153 RepID=A0A3D8PWA5_9BACI|nr:GNAT family protein [Oceanobacillus arenosus]RDW20314.1 GNAT family N-acetyltransferase [Oceanobacillus arenosus]
MKLHEYKPSFKSKIENYTLTEEQLRYTGTPVENVALAEIDADRHAILAIEENELVTFFVLHENEGVKPYSENPKAILLRAFSTDFNHQGKGNAKKALMLLPQYVCTEFPYADEIVLAANLNNYAAQLLYKKCGYIDEGLRKMGRKGELIIMSYYLN